MPVELRAVDATALGAAALAAVGAGVLGSIEEIADLMPPERTFTPRAVVDTRVAWREFVTRAAELNDPEAAQS